MISPEGGPRAEKAPHRRGQVSERLAADVLLPRLAPDAEIEVDVPSRLAEGLAEGRFDVALIPSIEYLRNPGCTIVSDCCIASDGPVRSIMLYSRVPLERISSLSLDEGSRTSAALVQIWLREHLGLRPALRPLPIGAAAAECPTDAVMLIGDRGLRPAGRKFEFSWDLGEEWNRWTGLPFVFALWVARPGVESDGLAQALAAARDEGLTQLPEIARQAAPAVGVPEGECLRYLRDHLEFHLGPRQRQGMELFFELARRHGLAANESPRPLGATNLRSVPRG